MQHGQLMVLNIVQVALEDIQVIVQQEDMQHVYYAKPVIIAMVRKLIYVVILVL